MGKIPNKVIEVKSDPELFDLIWRGSRNFDIREIRNQKFNAGDILLQREFDRRTEQYSGRTTRHLILWVLKGPAYAGLNEENYIISLHPDAIKREKEF
jgi:hypothetical protein